MTKDKIEYFLHGKRFQITAWGSTYEGKLVVKRYTEGNRIALQGVSIHGEPLFVLTVNIPEVELEPDEIIIKTWSENEPMADYMRKTGWFTDTGKRAQTGYVTAEIWRVNYAK